MLSVRDRSAFRVPRSALRPAFTLIELLVVVGILLILATTTVMLINTTLDSDRGRSAARTLQSALAGARDRALYTTRSPQGPRNVGLRLIIENPFGADGQPGVAGTNDNATAAFGKPADAITDNILHPTTGMLAELGWPGSDDEYWVTKMVYVEQVPPRTQGLLDVGPLSTPPAGNPQVMAYLASKGWADTDLRYVYGGPDANGQRPEWNGLYKKGLLVDGSIIRIPNDPTGVLYTVDTYFVARDIRDATSREILILTTPVPATLTGVTYSLDLEPAVAPNTEPIELPRNILIDLFYSDLPPVFRTRADRIDIMYTPRGTIAGAKSSAGLVHFLLRDLEDVVAQRTPAVSDSPLPNNSQREQFVITLFTQTGAVSSHAADPRDGNNNGMPDNLFRFAIEGEVAGQ